MLYVSGAPTSFQVGQQLELVLIRTEVGKKHFQGLHDSLLLRSRTAADLQRATCLSMMDFPFLWMTGAVCGCAATKRTPGRVSPSNARQRMCFSLLPL